MGLRSGLTFIRNGLKMIYLGLRVIYSAWKAGREMGNNIAHQLEVEDRFHSHIHNGIDVRFYEGEPCPICNRIDHHVEK